MNAQDLLAFLTRGAGEYYSDYDRQLPQYVPRTIGVFGLGKTDRWAQYITINGEKFLVIVEKSPNQ